MSRTPDDPDVARARADARRFARALGRLSREEFSAFVAALWRARGRRVERNGTTLTVWDDRTSGGERRLVATHARPDGVDRGVRTGSDGDGDGASGRPARVVTSRRVEGEHPDVVDADELLRMVRYAVGRERAGELLERTLGGGAASFAETGRETTEPGRPLRGRVLRGVTPSSRVAVSLMVVGCLAFAVVVGVAVAGIPFDGSAPTGGSPLEPVPTTAPGTATTTDRGTAPALRTTAAPDVDYASLDCPAPPTGVHPRWLRPGVVPGASSSGLDGWQIRSATNVTTFEARAGLGLPSEPLVRHLVRYGSPDRGTFELALDRWASRRAATEAGPALADSGDATVRWGVYTVTVRAFDREGDPIAADARTGRVAVLISHVQRPSGITLGDLCVRSLLDRGNE
jgi:hypothetical protein